MSFLESGKASTMGEALRECVESLGGIQRKPTIERWVNAHYPDQWKPNTLQGHLYGCCVNNPSGIKHHRHFPRFLYYRGNGDYEMYDSAKHGVFDQDGYPEGQAPVYSSAAEEIRDQVTEELEQRIGTEFAYEAHLRDYLASNLKIIEPGLVLWTSDKNGSVEYQLDGRRIDILAKDRANTPVVIELKLSKGHERTVGQALYYRAKLKQVLAVARVRIILVAAEITDELRLASSEVGDVDLYQYALTMQVSKVSVNTL